MKHAGYVFKMIARHVVSLYNRISTLLFSVLKLSAREKKGDKNLNENPVGILCVEGCKHVEVVKAVAGLWGIPVVYYNRDKNCITRQFVEQID